MHDAVADLRAENDELRERVRQLEDLLRPSAVTVPPQWRLTATEAAVFRHLVSRPMATFGSLEAALYSDRADDCPDRRILSVWIWKLRRKVEPHGVRIETVWGQGWRLHDRERYRSRDGG